ncbi:hypothetical protein [Phytoactinopolyspora alkaliphila]|uniref:hypothetical protein n=1 Tax=Phytoactinopolyspora alkaliphila TaxID=1783498 RepID=UPI001FE4E80E|nr:hypothetical protein [Phytoactinopolyspora alkaliphila]
MPAWLSTTDLQVVEELTAVLPRATVAPRVTVVRAAMGSLMVMVGLQVVEELTAVVPRAAVVPQAATGLRMVMVGLQVVDLRVSTVDFAKMITAPRCRGGRLLPPGEETPVVRARLTRPQ